MKKRKKILILALALVIAFTFSACGASEAQKSLDSTVKSANTLLEKNAKAYDPGTKKALKKAVDDSESAKEDSECKKAEKKIKNARKSYEDSIKQLKQVTAPKESFLIERAKQVKSVTEVEAATEKTDVNKMMNKKGGYYAYVAMKSSLVPDEIGFYKDQSPVEAGNDGGAVIEAFKTVKEAKARDEYLGGFDTGGAMASGSHKVVGTLVIRTSNELTATQQTILEKRIINALIKLDK